MKLTKEEVQVIREVIAFVRSTRTGEDVTIYEVVRKMGVLSALCDRASCDDSSTPSTRVVAIERRVGDLVTRTEFA